LGARTKINGSCVLGSLTIAGLIGGLTASWTIFAVAGAVLIATSVYAGDIRLRKRGRR